MLANLLAKHKTLLYRVVFFFPIILYLNTVPNEYALDDSIVITENIFVQKGIRGIKDIFTNDSFTGFFKQKKELVEGGRYRPLSLASFALEHTLFGDNPHISHLVNALLYGLLCLIILYFLKSALSFLGNDEIAFPVAFFSVILFASHPVHTEVVANIKGRDEILTMIFGILSLHTFLLYIKKGRVHYAIFSGILMLLGLLSKENALAFGAIALLLMLFSFENGLKLRYAAGLLSITIGVAVYLFIRIRYAGQLSTQVSTELMNNPFLFAEDDQKIATILFTLLIYLRFLVFPHPLTYDYYPYHISLHSWTEGIVIFSLLVHIFILFYAITAIRRNRLISFAIFFYFITLLPVSNLFINIGSFMNERFIFFGSLGFCLVVSYYFYLFYTRINKPQVRRTVTFLFFLIVLIVFPSKVVTRNTRWKNNFTLFTHDVKISSGSAKGNCAAGGVLLDKAKTEPDVVKKQEYIMQSIGYLTTALKIYPSYADALLLLGNAYYYQGNNFPKIHECYMALFRLSPGYETAFQNYSKILATTGNPGQKKEGYKLILKYRKNDFDANYQLGLVYGKLLHQVDSALIYLSKSIELQPNSNDANRDMGVALAMSGNTKQALYYFEKTIELDPNDAINHINLGVAYQNLGQAEKAAIQFNIAEELKAKNSR